MAPQKFGSMRHKARPAAATAAPRLTPFRDDSLVALRYEQTKQAEPPIPLPPPRNPRRLTRASSTFTASTAPTSPITINPPPVPPPQEEHPLFRSQRPLSRSQADDAWKRDSCAATSSSATLREDGVEDPFNHKILDDIDDAPSVYSDDGEDIASPSQTSDNRATPTRLIVSIPPRLESLETTVNIGSPTRPSPSQPAPPSRHTSLTKKLSKSFGIGPGGSRKLRKKMLGTDRAASQAAPPETAPVRGSPKSPKSPRSPKLSPQQPGPDTPDPSKVSVDWDQPEAPLTPATDVNFFAPITTPIPDDSLWEDLGAVSFSKRGSIMFGERNNNILKSIMTPTADAKAHAQPEADAHATSCPSPFQPEFATTTTADSAIPFEADTTTVQADETIATTEKPRAAPPADAPSVPSIRVSSMDVERESQKVRSLYESGDDLNWEDGGRVSFAERLEPTAEVPSEEEENGVSSRPSGLPSASGPAQSGSLHPTPATTTPRSANSLSPLRDSQVRRDHERAGGIEDWADLEGAEVDRYGFISPKRPVSRADTSAARSSHFSSRRRNVLTKRPSTSYSSSLPGGFIRPPSRKVSARSLNTYTSDLSTVSRRSTRSSIRSATNRLPHNRDRRWMDEAGEMLSLQAGLTGITDDEKMGKTLEAQKRKEAERSEKWRKMATAVNATGGSSNSKAPEALPDPQSQVPQGQGMSYTFDTTSPKLIDRTWKGVPDCWRSAAWYSFLSTSARAHNSPETDDYLIAEFRRLQAVASPDDVQIDLDVPRTVNGHIMFRRRYRGGQRLLFRVLHAISLYFPGTGYVQGMASLAATLLCYFDEERAFVMLVRLWRYRGLEVLYQPGFGGLMGALGEFEKRWLAGAGRDVAAKLNELGIDATAYGTRWYLTLFNLSIPFPAQLRVWDVFMLLGDCPPEPSTSSPPSHQNLSVDSPAAADANLTLTTTTITSTENAEDEKPPKGLDILHATSAALIHALRDVLLDSDFENAMKALTAWIPIRDEDLLMKVVRAEWRRHQGGRRLWEWERGRGGSSKEGGKEGKEGVKQGRDSLLKGQVGAERKDGGGIVGREDGVERAEGEGREGKEKEAKEGKGKGRGLGRLWDWERDRRKENRRRAEGGEGVAAEVV